MPVIMSYEIPIYNKKHVIIRKEEKTPIHRMQVGQKFRLRGVSGSYRVTHEILWDRNEIDYFILAVNTVR